MRSGDKSCRMQLALIETMRVVDSGEVYLLERHLARLSRSARHFSFQCDLGKVRDAITSAATGPSCLRLTLASDGEVRIEMRAIPRGYVEELKLSSLQVNSFDEFLYHKTTNRTMYGKDIGVILVNERGEITETPIMNIAVLRDSRWVTPAVSCGLLPGIMREELLSRGEIVEGVISAVELRPGEIVRCFNALRGIHDVPVVV